MKILIVDDEMMMLAETKENVLAVSPDSEITCVDNYVDALNAVEETTYDIACLDIEMPVMNGVELAKKVKLLNPDINIIFTTGYSEYMKDAFELHVSGYLLKPITPEKIRAEFDNLRCPVQPLTKNRVRFQTFGNFEVFIDGEPVKFKYGLTKEMLAYLVDRKGTLCTNGEIMATLWEDKKSFSYLRSLKADLMKVLKEAKCENVIASDYGKMGIVKEKVDCDYYDWLDNKIYAINLYKGEYMAQYSWGEVTNAGIKESIRKDI